jgi:hypothetical protein
MEAYQFFSTIFQTAEVETLDGDVPGWFLD